MYFTVLVKVWAMFHLRVELIILRSTTTCKPTRSFWSFFLIGVQQEGYPFLDSTDSNHWWSYLVPHISLDIWNSIFGTMWGFQWACPAFVIPGKYWSIQKVSNFCKLNKVIIYIYIPLALSVLNVKRHVQYFLFSKLNILCNFIP